MGDNKTVNIFYSLENEENILNKFNSDIFKVYDHILEKGTHEFPIIVDKSKKLSIVGFCTKSLGGNKKISLKGLKALLMA